MNIYEIYYITKGNFIDNIFVEAPNRIAAWAKFAELTKNFEDEIIGADCFLLEENFHE